MWRGNQQQRTTESKTMNELALLLMKLNECAHDLDAGEFDPGTKNYLLDDIHRLRGRLMQGANNQDWQRVNGSVTVTVE
jgi:hypothetical protein